MAVENVGNLIGCWTLTTGVNEMRDALAIFYDHFRKWVRAFNDCKSGSYSADADDLLQMLRDRIRPECLMVIGGGLHYGWIRQEAGDGRGHFITSNDRDRSGGLMSVYNIHQGRIAPWWELYVQLADYVQLRFLA